MRAALCRRYGSPDVVELAEMPKPVPGDHEVLIAVRATTVTSGDWRVRSRTVPRGFGTISRLVLGWSAPRQPILGTELSGVIEAVGKAVSRFKVGDEVFAFSGIGMGCHAEYKCMSEDAPIALKPAKLSFEEAAALSFGGTTALHFLRQASLQRGERVLINGASGGVGTAAIQLAKHFGAHVTAVCSTVNVELVRSIGADEVIDYTHTRFAETGKTFDVIMDVVGTAPHSRCKAALKQNGRLLLVLSDLPAMLEGAWVSMTSGQKVIAGPAPENAADLLVLAKLAESGELKLVIDRTYPFDQIADAHRLVDSGRKRGNVVVTLP